VILYSDFLTKLERTHDYGKYMSAMCPFHSDNTTPSLLVYKDGWFRCLSANCSRTGSWKMLWNKLNGQPIRLRSETRTIFQAPTRLDEYENLHQLCYQAHNDLEQFESWAWYLEQRGLDDSIEIAEIGYHRGWYTIPVYDRDRNFVTAVFRAAPHVQESTGLRYWCGHAPVMYCPDWNLMVDPKFIVVVFGMFDALTVNKFRVPVVTSTAGADSFKAEWLDDWRVPIYILHDKGEETTGIRLASKLGWRGQDVSLDFPKGCKDANDFVKNGKSKELEVALLGLENRRIHV
jgi:hypothetical protein